MPSRLHQLPSEDGRRALSFNSTDLVGLISQTGAKQSVERVQEADPMKRVNAPSLTMKGSASGTSHPGSDYPALWRWIYDELKVSSVLEMSQGVGSTAAFFRNLGCETFCVHARQESDKPSCETAEHLYHDYTEGPWVPDTGFDMVWCCDFLEQGR